MKALYTTTFHYNFDAYRKFSQTIHDKLGKYSLKKYGFAGLFAAAGTVLLFLNPFSSLLPAFAALGGAALMLIGTKISEERQAKKVWDSNALLKNGKNITLDFYDDHLEQKTNISHSFYGYSDFRDFIETDDYFYLMVASNQGLIVDKKNCSEEMHRFIREKVRKAA